MLRAAGIPIATNENRAQPPRMTSVESFREAKYCLLWHWFWTVSLMRMMSFPNLLRVGS